MADKGYIGVGALIPTGRRALVEMRVAMEEGSRWINRLRLVVERVIAQVKTLRVLHTEFEGGRDPTGLCSQWCVIDFLRVYEPL